MSHNGPSSTQSRFKEVFKKGSRCSRNLFTLYFLRRDGVRWFGISVARGFGSAVDRNKAKRIVREFFRRAKKDIPDGAAIIKFKGTHKKFLSSELRADLDKMLERLK